MKTPNIPPVKLPENHMGRYAQQGHPQHSRANPQQIEKVNADGVTGPSMDRIHLNKLENTKAQFHEIAQQIRTVKETMVSVEAQLTKMREALESVVKIYPPYPPGSSERIDALRQFTALRKMIDQLTTLPSGVNKGLVSSDSDLLNRRLSISRYQMHTGKKGLDIPHLDPNSTDQHLHDAIEKVAAAQHTVGRHQTAFVADANALIAEIT